MKITWIGACRSFATTALILTGAMAAAIPPPVPLVLNYQAKLTDTNGLPLSTTTTLIFSIWDAPVSGSPLGAFLDADDVLPANGVVSMLVGDDPGNLIPTSIWDSGATRWLEVQVNGNTLSPRTALVSVPYAMRANSANSAVSATVATNAVHASTADLASSVTGLVKSLPMDGQAYVIVEVTADPVQNGINLVTAYNRAEALTPHGQPLSARNRAMVVVLPGQYDMTTGTLLMITNYVDLVGLSTARTDQYIFGESSGQGTGILRQTASDVRIENLLVECTRSSGGLTFSASDPAAYFPDGALAGTVVTNCEFRADGTNAYSTRRAVEYSGTYTNCTGGRIAWGGFGTASGIFTDCIGGTASFGGLGIANGVFKNCTAIDNSFGGLGGTASGTFQNCTGTGGSFGGSGGTASGNFTNCTGGTDAFGGLGFSGFASNASGTFTNCVGGSGAFGGISGIPIGPVTVTVSGTFSGCIGGSYSFGGGPAISGNGAGGKFLYCNGGTSSFTATGAPLALYCVKNGAAYP
ncbi:MAG: hypothetical protein K1X53_07890 [Candidatus Sumerlaeaceae bacterium]|nr:hypothetical protein [Candidatus Sumerlaeaceae bacterium]